MPSSIASRIHTQRPLDPVATRLRMQPVVVDAVRAIAFSPDGAKLAAGTGTGEIQLWDVARKTLVHRWNAHGHWVFDVEFHPDSNRLLSGGGDGFIQVWSLVDYRSIRELAGHTDDVHGAVFVAHSEQVLSGSDDATVRLWDLESGSQRVVGRHGKQVTTVAVSPDGKWGASGSRDGTVRLWNLSTPDAKPLEPLQGHEQDVLSVAFDRDGRRLVTASYDQTVGVWDVATRKRLHTITGHTGWVFIATWGFGDTDLYSGSGDRTLRYWSLKDPQPRLIENLYMDADVADLAIHPEKGLVAAALDDGAIALFKVVDAKLRKEEQLFAPPIVVAPPAAPTDLKVSQQWVNWHLTAADPTQPNWDHAVASLGDAGTAWTRQYLAALDRSRMSPAQTDLLDRALYRLEKSSESLSPATVRRWLERAAWCDLGCNALESKLVPWTKEQVRNAAADPKLRDALREIAKSYKPVGGEPEALLYDTFEQRVRLYAAEMLQSTGR